MDIIVAGTAARAFLKGARIRLLRRPFVVKLVVQMTGHAKLRRKSDHHIVDSPTVVLAAVVVVLLIAATGATSFYGNNRIFGGGPGTTPSIISQK
ncbi:MAG: hypothetical protein ABSD09_18590 [Xanthobacteraceae bacterium]